MAECIKVTAMFCGNCFYKVSDGEVRRCLERVSWPSNKKAHGVSLPRIKPLSVPWFGQSWGNRLVLNKLVGGWRQIYEQWIFPLCSNLPSQTSDWKVAWGTGTSSKGKRMKVKGISSGPCEAWCDTLPTIEHLSLLTEIFMSTVFLSWMVWDELLLFTFLCYAPVQWTPNAVIACGVPGELV